MDKSILQEVGLSNTESKVYLALLSLGSALAGEITKKSEVNRTNVYDALERLIEKGLVTHIISSNRKVFEPVNPERLREILKEKEGKLDSIMKELVNSYESNKNEEEATIFKGKKGIISIFENVLKERKTVCVYGAERRFTTMFPAYQKIWHKERKKLGIKVSIIWNEKFRRKREDFPLLSRKYLPKQYDFPSTVLIYGDCVATIVWGDWPIGFLIKSKEVAKSNQNFFNILWKVAKK